MTTKLEPGTSFQTPTGWTCDAHRGGEIVARFYGADCAERARKFCEHSNVPPVPACPAGEHTPGQWTVQYRAETFAVIGDGDEFGGARLVATVNHSCDWRLSENNRCAAADAALIARAPALLAENAKLLEILRETLRVLVTPDGVPDANKGRTKEQHSALLNARAALAEGGGK